MKVAIFCILKMKKKKERVNRFMAKLIKLPQDTKGRAKIPAQICLDKNSRLLQLGSFYF